MLENNFQLIARLPNVNMLLRQYMIVFCLLLLVTLGNSYSMKYVVDRLEALETKLESESKLRRELETKLESESKLRRELETKLESESKLRRSETEELFRMISELAGVKIPPRDEQLAPDENKIPGEQLTTKTPLADKHKTTELAIELRDLESYIKGVAAEKQQNVKLRAELKNISKQLKADYIMFESRINEEIRNFTNDVSDKLTLLVSEERFNNLSDFVTTTQSELRNEARQSLISLNSNVETSIQKLSNDFRTVNQTAMKNVERFNNVSDSLTIVTDDLNKVMYVNPCKSAPKSNGIYYMHYAKSATPLRVYCDQQTDGGGWLVIQRRKDGSVDFYRNWADYKTGFGDIENEFWIGNDNIHTLTSPGLNELRIDMMDFEGNKAYAKYSKFKVHPESELYKLEVGGYSGNASNSFAWYHNGQAFSTKDRDNDKWSGVSCSELYRGAWWYGSCAESNLNGLYYHDGYSHGDSIFWSSWKGYYYSLKTVEMKIR